LASRDEDGEYERLISDKVEVKEEEEVKHKHGSRSVSSHKHHGHGDHGLKTGDAHKARHSSHQQHHSYSNPGGSAIGLGSPSRKAAGSLLDASLTDSPDTKTDKDKDKGQKADAAEDEGGTFSNAVVLLTAAVLIPLVVNLAHKDGMTGILTLKMLDVFLAVFFGNLWYSVWDQAMIAFHMRQMFQGSAQLWSAAVVIFIYATAQTGLESLSASGSVPEFEALKEIAAFTIAFALVLAGNVSQLGVSQLSSNPVPIAGSFGVCLLMECFCRLVFFLNYKAHLRDCRDQRVLKAMKQMESKIRAVTIGFCIAQAVRHFAAGTYAPVGRSILANGGQGADGFVTTFSIWLVCIALIGCFVVPQAKAFGLAGQNRYDVKAYLVMTVSWSYLLLFEFVLFWYKTQPDALPPELATSLFATVTSLAAVAKMTMFAQQYPDAGQTRDARETRDIFIEGLAFAAAWSWGMSYKMAFDVVGKRYQVGFGGLVPKLGIAIVIPIFMLPPYANFLKPAQLQEQDPQDEPDDESTAGQADGTASPPKKTDEVPATSTSETQAAPTAEAASKIET